MHYHTLNITIIYQKQSEIKLKPKTKLTQIGTGTKYTRPGSDSWLVVQFSRNVHLLSWKCFQFCYCQAVTRTAEDLHCVNYMKYNVQCTYTSYWYTLYLMGKTYHYWKHRVIQLAIRVVFLWGTPEQDVLTEKTNKWYLLKMDVFAMSLLE